MALNVPAPVAGLIVQVTPVLDPLVTVAVIDWVWLADKLAVGGLTEIVTAGKLIVYKAVVTVLSAMPDL